MKLIAKMAMPTCPHAFGLVMLMVTVAGCGEPGRTTLPIHPVSGKVAISEGKPVTSGTICFEPVAAPGVKAKGKIQPDGSFTLTTYNENDGAVEGDSRVYIEPDEAAKKGAIPTAFLDPDSSGVIVKVSPGKNDLGTISLRSKSGGSRDRR